MSLINIIDKVAAASSSPNVQSESSVSLSPDPGTPLASDTNEDTDGDNSRALERLTSQNNLPLGKYIQVRLPPLPSGYEEYLVRDGRVKEVLKESQRGRYVVLTRDGEKTIRSAAMITFDDGGKKAFADFKVSDWNSDISDSGSDILPHSLRARVQASNKPNATHQLDGQATTSGDDSLSETSDRPGRLRLTFRRGESFPRVRKHVSPASSDFESEASDSGSHTTKRHRGRPFKVNKAPVRQTRVSNQPRVAYDFGLLSDGSEENSRGSTLGKRKRRHQHGEATRRSERTKRGAFNSMRERGEDEIEEVEAQKATPKVSGARETFQRLPKDNSFRKRHSMTCDTCGKMGDSSEKGDLIFCQSCTMSYHRVCIGHRTSRDHLVTKVGDKDFVLQCRRCVELARQKDKTAPHQGRCGVCKKPGAASYPFRIRKTPAQEQKDREQNGGQDPIQHVSSELINNAENVLFRCRTCFSAFHLFHLEPRLENPLEGDDPSQKAANRFSEYSSDWTCHVCESRPTPSLQHAVKANIGALIAWRPTQDADYRSGETVDQVAEDEKEYLIKWTNMSHYSCRWMPGWWVWGYSNSLMRIAFAKRDNGRNLPTMRTEDAIPEDWLRIDIVFSVKYTNLVQAQIEEVDIARIKEVARVYAKFKGLTHEEAVWTEPPDIEETERYEDFRSAYVDYIRGKYIRPPTYKRVSNELQKLRPNTEEERKAVFNKRMILKDQPPELLNGKLMDYQLEGVNWLLFQWQRERNAILADEMGLGKTIQVISFLAALKENHGLWPFLIVVPNATCANWRREIKQWAPHMRVVTYFGSEKARTLAMDHELFGDREKSTKPLPTDLRCHIVVTSYEAASDPTCLAFFKKITWQAMIVDEGQRLKNDKTILYGNLLSVKAPFRLLLTGTPLQNNQRELFNLLHFLDKEKNAEELEAEYAELNSQLIKQLHDMIRPYFLRRTKAQVLTFLPPMGQVIVPITMSTLQRELYKNILSRNAQLLKAILSKRESSEKSNTISGLRNILVQLRKCLCHPFVYNLEIEERTDNATVSHRRLVAASPKLTLLEMMLPKLRERGHRVLFFSQFLGMLTIMEDFLDGMEMPYLRLDGSQSSLEKQKIIDAYNATDSKYFAMLLSTRAGGVGINLASADTVIILDPDFNPHQDIQAIARAHRIGQEKKVLVFKMMTRDTAEERIVQVGKKKMVLDHVIVDQMESEDNDGADLESVLAFGAQALFNDEVKDIVYDENSVEKLLDRSQVEDTKVSDGEEASQENAFSFARVWQNETAAMGELSMPDAEQGIDSGVWDKILAARAREAEEERRKKEAAMGRGKRARNVVNYAGDAVKAKAHDSDTDFAAKSSDESDNDSEGNVPAGLDGAQEEVRDLAMDDKPAKQEWQQQQHRSPDFSRPLLTYMPLPTSQTMPWYSPQNPPRPHSQIFHQSAEFHGKSHKKSEQVANQRNNQNPYQKPLRPTYLQQPPELPSNPVQLRSKPKMPNQSYQHFTRATISVPESIEKGPDRLPCLACKDIYGAHTIGSCPLKVAGPEFCNLCGLAHFGFQRTCPHLNSETQVRLMLEALKSSPEDPELVKKAKLKLQGIKGSLVQAKKRKVEQRLVEERARFGNHNVNDPPRNITHISTNPSSSTLPTTWPAGSFEASAANSVFYPGWNVMASQTQTVRPPSGNKLGQGPSPGSGTM